MGIAWRHPDRDRTTRARHRGALGSPVRIREFGDRDLAAVMALWRACVLTRPWNPPERDIEFCRSSAHAKLFVAEAQGCIVGSIMVGHDGHRGWVYYVAVDPSHRHDGLGRALMDRAERFLTDAGVP